MRKSLMLCALAVLSLACVALAGDDTPAVPDWYSLVFSTAMLQAIAAIIGFTQLVKNMLNAAGWVAVALAVVVSFGYAFTMYLGQGMWFCIMVGLAAAVPSALAYYGSKAIGRSTARAFK